MHLGTPVIAKDIEGNSAVIENEVDGLLYQDARVCRPSLYPL